MIDAILSYLEESAGKHVLALIITGAVVLAGYSWLQEHDNRLVAEQTVKASQSRITTLEEQSKAVAAAGQQKIVVLQAQAAAVKTPAQAIQAIPDLAPQLNARPVVGLPDMVEVAAVPLFQELNSCKQTAVSLGVCSTQLDIEHKVEAEKDIQITALKKKPAFWHRVKQTAEIAAIGAALGYAAHR